MLVSTICLKEGILSSTTQLITVHITRFAPWKPCNDVYNLFLVPRMRHETGPWHTTLTPFSRKSNNIMYCWPRHVTMSSSSCSLQSRSSDLTYFTTVCDQCLGTKDAHLSWRFFSLECNVDFPSFGFLRWDYQTCSVVQQLYCFFHHKSIYGYICRIHD